MFSFGPYLFSNSENILLILYINVSQCVVAILIAY